MFKPKWLIEHGLFCEDCTPSVQPNHLAGRKRNNIKESHQGMSFGRLRK